MEASAASAGGGRTGSLPMYPAYASRKEWRAVSENQPSRNAANGDSERQKVGQVDERTIYEVQHGRQPLDVNFCAITIEVSSEDEVLRQLEGLVRKREDLQKLEIQLKARMIAKSEISEMKRKFDTQIKEYTDNGIKLQEQLLEKEQVVRDLERKIDKKDREIIAIKRNNEASWAKEDLLREQKKQLTSFRRERDHSEAERVQLIQQIHELQEHVQDKERQLMELQEQYRVAQEAIICKDDQLREAQAWIARMQEMDALQSHSLQAELRERTEQCNQLWLVWQRQFAEMEGFHLHRIQQLQVELADLKEQNGSLTSDSCLSQSNIKDVFQLGSSKGNRLDVNGSLQNEGVGGASLGSSTLVGLPAYIPPGQVHYFHPFVMHQQGVPQTVNSNIPPSEVGQCPSNNEQRGYMDAHVSQGMEHNASLSSSSSEMQVTEPIDGRHPTTSTSQLETMLPDISSNFHRSLGFDTPKQGVETKELIIAGSMDSMTDEQGSESEQTSTLTMSSPLISKSNEVVDDRYLVQEVGPDMISVGQSGMVAGAKSSDSNLLDERSLLACVVRTIPTGGRIRISSTLPNRLAKILAPLHWHDYKKKYGRLDEFVASHPGLFMIEADYIQLREGAQEMIAAKAAVAKVAAAAAASATYSSSLPTVSVTPLAQAHRQRIAPSISSKQFHAAENRIVSADDPLHLSGKHHYQNGVHFNIDSGTSGIEILTKAKDSIELNGVENKATHFSSFIANGEYAGKSCIISNQSKGEGNGRLGSNIVPDHRAGQMDISQLYADR